MEEKWKKRERKKNKKNSLLIRQFGCSVQKRGASSEALVLMPLEGEIRTSQQDSHIVFDNFENTYITGCAAGVQRVAFKTCLIALRRSYN
jgi:hypothetical protein